MDRLIDSFFILYAIKCIDVYEVEHMPFLFIIISNVLTPSFCVLCKRLRDIFSYVKDTWKRYQFLTRAKNLFYIS